MANTTKPLELRVSTRDKDLMFAIEQHFDSKKLEYKTTKRELPCKFTEKGYIELYIVKAWVEWFASNDLIELEKAIGSKDYSFQVDYNIDAFLR